MFEFIQAQLAPTVSLHGGHSTPCCAHSDDPLPDQVLAAVERGFTTFGVVEHAPRCRLDDLDPDEIEQDFTPERMQRSLRAHTDAVVPDLRRRHRGRLLLPFGMETDTAPEAGMIARMRALRAEYRLDYLIASVHHVAEIPIDSAPELYRRAAQVCGGEEALQLRYYELQAELIEQLRPEIVGHFDLIRRYATDREPSRRVRRRALDNLVLMRETGTALEVNASSIRDGEPSPYPDRWLLAEAHRRSIDISLADDSHSVAEVGAGLQECAEFARDVGYREMLDVRSTDTARQFAHDARSAAGLRIS